MSCTPCGRGFHRECRKGCKKCHPVAKKRLEPEITEIREPRDPKKNNLKDPESTGRKRAAQLYPIDPSAECEWRGQKNCGGGRRPIIGCSEGLQQHRHHGPVKRTTRNELGNVHRICDDCHVHWHELNDLIYDEKDYNLLPHAPEPADPVEIMQNVLDWKSGEMGRRYQLASSLNRKKGAEKNVE